MSKLRRFRVKVAGSDHTVVMQLDPDTAKERYPEAVEVAARADGDTRTKQATPQGNRTKAASKSKAPAKDADAQATAPDGKSAPEDAGDGAAPAADKE